MRVIMLDIDGVLNSVGSFIYNNRMQLLGLSDTPTHTSFCPVSSSNLLYVLEELPDLQIVITSTWRKFDSHMERLNEFFKTLGIFEKVVGKTPRSEEGYRGKEIESYLKDHPEVTEFVIIDDDSDMKPYMDRLVKTNGSNGLTFTDAQKVIEMFGGTDEKETK